MRSGQISCAGIPHQFASSETPVGSGDGFRTTSESSITINIRNTLKTKGSSLEPLTRHLRRFSMPEPDLNDLHNRRAKQYAGGAVVPAIFTTASLVASETELAGADFKTGRMSDSDGAQKTWLWYDHNLTSRLRPSLPPAPRETLDNADLLLALDRDMTKSVAIVTPDGIEAFLGELPGVLTSFSRDDRI